MHFANTHNSVCSNSSRGLIIIIISLHCDFIGAITRRRCAHEMAFLRLCCFAALFCSAAIFTVMSALGMRGARASRSVLSAGNLHINSWFRCSQIIDAV
jgi:hypothetical protein